MSEVRIHIESVDDFFNSALEMAKRLDAGDRAAESASISFESMELLLKVLTPNRWTLLRTLRANGPSSIRALSQLLARDYRGVHADVTALIDAGLIERADGKISVPWSRITAEMAVDIAA
ncbi:winged helix DNA-binding protein [Allomesorhizobium camelthorni]|uniref:Winged helix DNA-binding protein n=1 Tax=Allomesorhizobium camelthorni TaxID=475069 RepID=A0A6G4WBW8_9HYPH|nr:winged helix DNA-binding protein [Mesorhizobium camelthorni]NGO52272.1 winged helix DNA-binding protein [Mesorhizobium camelthorni]